MEARRPFVVGFTHAWFASTCADVQVGNVHARTGADAMDQLRRYDGMWMLESRCGRVRVRFAAHETAQPRDDDAPVVLSANGIREMLFIDYVRLVGDCVCPGVARAVVNTDTVFYRILSAYGFDRGRVAAVAMQIAPQNTAVAKQLRAAVGTVGGGAADMCAKLEALLRGDPTEYVCNPIECQDSRRFAWSCASCGRVATIGDYTHKSTGAVHATLRTLAGFGGLYCGITVCALGPMSSKWRLADRAEDTWTPRVLSYNRSSGVDVAFVCSRGPARGGVVPVPPAYTPIGMPECTTMGPVAAWRADGAIYNYARLVAENARRGINPAPVEVLALVHIAATADRPLFVPVGDGEFTALVRQAAANASAVQRPSVGVNAKWVRDWWPYATDRIPPTENAAVALLARALVPLLPTTGGKALVEVGAAHLLLQIDPDASRLFLGSGITLDDAVSDYIAYSSDESHVLLPSSGRLRDACATIARVGCGPSDPRAAVSLVMRAMQYRGMHHATPAEFAPVLAFTDLASMHRHETALADGLVGDDIVTAIAVDRAGRGLPVNPDEIDYRVVYTALGNDHIPTVMRNTTRFEESVVLPILYALVFTPTVPFDTHDSVLESDHDIEARARVFYNTLCSRRASADHDRIASFESAVQLLLALAARTHDDAAGVIYNAAPDVSGHFFRSRDFMSDGRIYPATLLVHAIRHPFMPRGDAVHSLALHALETRGGDLARDAHACITRRDIVVATHHPRAWSEVLHGCVAHGQCAQAVHIATAAAACLAAGLATETEKARADAVEETGASPATMRSLLSDPTIRLALHTHPRP